MEVTSRPDLTELMDEPDVDVEALKKSLAGLARVNLLLGGYAPSLDGFHRLAKGADRLSLLDVGTGSGDTPRRFCEWARVRGIDLFVKAVDVNPICADYARQRCIAYQNIEVEKADLFQLDDREPFDIVHAALMLHHLNDSEIVEALQKMYALSRRGVVINDLHRHKLAYRSARLVLPLLSRSPIVRHDGPVSVRRGFTHHELYMLANRAGLPKPEIRWFPFFRWQMLFRKDGAR